MPTRSHERRQLQRVQNGLAIAGNGCYLVGSVLYVMDAPYSAAWWFVVGSVAAVLSGILPRLVRLWIQPRESEGDPSAPSIASAPA